VNTTPIRLAVGDREGAGSQPPAAAAQSCGATVSPHPDDAIRIVILGEPVAQGRPRAFKTPAGYIRTYDPSKSRNWKGVARDVMAKALTGGAILHPEGPCEVHVLAVFSCPRSQFRKRDPWPRRPHAKRPDAENVAKAVLDSGTGLLWGDDSQIARLTIEKLIGAQGEAPFVEVRVGPLEARP